MKKITRLIAALVLLSMLLMLFAACGEEAGSGSGSGQPGVSDAASSGTQSGEETSGSAGEETVTESDPAENSGTSDPSQTVSEEEPAVSGADSSEEPSDPTSKEPGSESSEEPSDVSSHEPKEHSGEQSSGEVCRHASTVWVTGKKPGCETKGEKTEYCEDCGAALRIEEIPAEGHRFGAWAVTKEATETKEGEKTATCVKCGATQKAVIPKKKPTKPFKEVDPADYYGVQYLAKQKDSAVLLDAYHKLVEHAGKAEAEFTIPYLDETTLRQVYACYIADYPQHFWVQGGYKYSYATGADVMTLKPVYVSFPGGLEKAKQAVESALQKYLKLVDSSMTPYEIELALHDALLLDTEWRNLDNDIVHTAYGSLIDHIAVCDGFTAALRILLGRCGIETIKVCGKMGNVNHVWMMVKLDGTYYHLDPTADDPTGDMPCVVHGFFNISTASIAKSHKISDNCYTIPECKSDKNSYVSKYCAVIKSLSVDAIANAMVTYYQNIRQDMVFELFFENTDAVSILDYLGDHMNELVTVLIPQIPEMEIVSSIEFCVPDNCQEIVLVFE